jgi:fibronectin-binding autotransporter adhesin
VGDAATSGSLGGDIANLATLKFNRTDQQTLTNVVSGTGIFIKDNSNTLTLTSAQTYAGSTTVRRAAWSSKTTLDQAHPASRVGVR